MTHAIDPVELAKTLIAAPSVTASIAANILTSLGIGLSARCG